MMKRLLLFAAFTSFLLNPAFSSPEKNGFDLQDSLIPAQDIHQGGPGKDGIPSIDKPKFLTAGEAEFLKADDRILGVVVDGEAKAYPIRILNWHELVNDTVGGKGVVVSYCPLCGTGMVFASQHKNQSLNFGVSGLLYNSDVLLYDRETQSLWSQILGKAVNGPLAGSVLESIPSSHTRWQDWQTRYPDTQVLSTDTGYSRDYSKSPYGSYDDNKSIYFPLSAKSNRYHPKERVLGICIEEQCKAYPFAELAQSSERSIDDDFAGQTLTINFDADNRDGEILDASGKAIPLVNGFWFAWFAFHPETDVYEFSTSSPAL